METLQKLASRRAWYAINRKAEDVSEITIYEDIGGFGVTAKAFADDLETIQAKTIHVRLNTEGGDTFDGIAIYNALRAHPATVIVHIDGLAASAGSVIAMSGDEIRMADNAFLMIHENQAGVFGEAGDLRKWAEVLEKLNDSLASTYHARAGKTRKYWREKMAEESWFTAEQAQAEGLCDFIDDRETVVQNRRFNFAIYNHAREVPAAVVEAWGQPNIENAPEASPCGDPPPAVPTQEPDMATENQPATAQNSGGGATPQQQAPAPPPTAIDEAEAQRREIEQLKGQTAKANFEQGRVKGHGQGRDAERERMKALVEICAGKPEMAISAFLSGQQPEAVKLAYDEAAKVEAAAKVREQQHELELARWRNLAATGGYPGGVAMGLSDSDGDEDAPGADGPLTKEAATKQAEAEWAHQPGAKKGYKCKENFVAYRVGVLTGRIRPTEPARQQA